MQGQGDGVKYKCHPQNVAVVFSALGISLTYKRKSKGPRVDPCGTPFSLGSDFDVWPSRETNWDCLRKVSIKKYAVPRIP